MNFNLINQYISDNQLKIFLTTFLHVYGIHYSPQEVSLILNLVYLGLS